MGDSITFTVKLPDGTAKPLTAPVTKSNGTATVSTMKLVWLVKSTVEGFIPGVAVVTAGRTDKFVPKKCTKTDAKTGQSKTAYNDVPIPVTTIHGAEEIFILGSGSDPKTKKSGAHDQVPIPQPAPTTGVKSTSWADRVKTATGVGSSSAKNDSPAQPAFNGTELSLVQAAQLTRYLPMVPQRGIDGRSREETLASIIIQRKCVCNAIEQDIAEWHAALPVDPLPSQQPRQQAAPPKHKAAPQQETSKAAPMPSRRPSQASNKHNPAPSGASDLASQVKTFFDRFVSGEAEQPDIATAIRIFDVVDHGPTRIQARYKIKGWRVEYASPCGQNLCWLSAPLQGAAGKTLPQNAIFSMLKQGFRPLITFLTDTFDERSLFNLFFARKEGSIAVLGQFSDMVPATLSATLKHLQQKSSNGEMGYSTVHHTLLATLLQTDIHVHMSAYLDDPTSSQAAKLASMDEVVAIYSPAGMERGTAKREIHIKHQDGKDHFDTILHAAPVPFEKSDELVPSTLLERAKEYILSLAKLNSSEVLRERYGDDYDPGNKHRPVEIRKPGEKRPRGVVDLSAAEAVAPRPERKTLAEEFAELKELLFAFVRQGPGGPAFTSPPPLPHPSTPLKPPSPTAAATARADAEEEEEDVEPSGPPKPSGPVGGGDGPQQPSAEQTASIEMALKAAKTLAGTGGEVFLQTFQLSNLVKSDTAAGRDLVFYELEDFDEGWKLVEENVKHQLSSLILARRSKQKANGLAKRVCQSLFASSSGAKDQPIAAQRRSILSYVAMLKILVPDFKLSKGALTDSGFSDAHASEILSDVAPAIELSPGSPQ